MPSRFHRVTSAAGWRAPALGALAGLTAAAAIVVPSALATGNGPPASTRKPPPPGTTVPSNNNCPSGAVPPAIASAIAQLKQAGTINGTQDQAIDAFLSHACSIQGLQPLVNDGTITAAQQRAVLDALAHAKMSLARAQGAHRQDAPPIKTQAAGEAAKANHSRTGPPDRVFTAAVARLEQAGTIDSTQAQAIDAQLQAGTVEGGLQQLVDSGTLTATQAQTVVTALAHAKMSLASTQGG